MYILVKNDKNIGEKSLFSFLFFFLDRDYIIDNKEQVDYTSTIYMARVVQIRSKLIGST